MKQIISRISDLLVYLEHLLSYQEGKMMAKITYRVVGKCQYAFGKGRQIMDMALVANKLADDLLFHNSEGVLCKLDMEKTYDHVSQGFFEYMLTRMDFVDK